MIPPHPEREKKGSRKRGRKKKKHTTATPRALHLILTLCLAAGTLEGFLLTAGALGLGCWLAALAIGRGFGGGGGGEKGESRETEKLASE